MIDTQKSFKLERIKVKEVDIFNSVFIGYGVSNVLLNLLHHICLRIRFTNYTQPKNPLPLHCHLLKNGVMDTLVSFCPTRTGSGTGSWGTPPGSQVYLQ